MDTDLVLANISTQMPVPQIDTLVRLFNELDKEHKGFVNMNDIDRWNPDVTTGSAIFDAFMRWARL